MERRFDLEETLEQIKEGASIDRKNGVLAPLIKQLTEAEIESHLSQELARNRRNGKSKKTMRSSVGEFVSQGHFPLSVRAVRSTKKPK